MKKKKKKKEKLQNFLSLFSKVWLKEVPFFFFFVFKIHLSYVWFSKKTKKRKEKC